MCFNSLFVMNRTKRDASVGETKKDNPEKFVFVFHSPYFIIVHFKDTTFSVVLFVFVFFVFVLCLK